MGEATADAGSDSEQGAGERLPSELVGGQPMRGGRDVEVTEVGSGERDVDLHRYGDYMSRPVAIVTGGSRGIGRATVERLLRDGTRVAFCGREERPGRQVLGELGNPPDAIFIPCEVARGNAPGARHRRPHLPCIITVTTGRPPSHGRVPKRTRTNGASSWSSRSSRPRLATGPPIWRALSSSPRRRSRPRRTR